jgi:diguanylate cyclase (GGDEF)-like protein
LFRLGGDEFCCLLPDTDASEAFTIAERMRRRIAATTMRVVDEPVKVTASVGVALTDSFGDSLDVLLYEADIATYAAKGQGRNRVVVAEPHAGPNVRSREADPSDGPAAPPLERHAG